MDKNRKTVSIVRCEDYGRSRVYEAVKKSIRLLNGIGQFVSPGESVFLKFNLLCGAAPETCIATHPDALYAVARILKEHGCKVVMGDSPGSGLPYTEAVLKDAYAKSGYLSVSEELSIPLNYDTGYETITAPSGRLVKRFSIIKPAVEADAIVVVSRAKTHPLTYLSGGTKNMFGVIPGLEKPLYHANYRSAEEFGSVLIDLNEAMKPRLQVMDAIMGMEGDGPHSGTPRKIGAVLASSDYSAIDMATVRLMAMDPQRISTISAAVERGYLRDDFSDVSIVGEPLENLIVRDYKRPSTYDTPRNENDSRMSSFISTVKSTIKPYILMDQCIGCLKCMRCCPVKAISVVNNKPMIDDEICIRCYCCHEMCDDHAIVLERSPQKSIS